MEIMKMVTGGSDDGIPMSYEIYNKTLNIRAFIIPVDSDFFSLFANEEKEKGIVIILKNSIVRKKKLFSAPLTYGKVMF